MIRMAGFKAAAVAAAPAQAHGGWVDISRGSCEYSGYSDHGYAKTQKGSGGCSGHAWLRVNWNGNISSWAHDPSRQSFTAPGGTGIRVSDHKSCGSCSYKSVRH